MAEGHEPSGCAFTLIYNPYIYNRERINQKAVLTGLARQVPAAIPSPATRPKGATKFQL